MYRARAHVGTWLRTALLLGGVVGPVRGQAPPAPVRVLGVFDDATGRAVAGVEVADIATGRRVTTSESGAASLAFLAAGTTVLQLRKIGYQAKMITVTTSPADTVPITVLLVPVAQPLPTVTTRARAARGDTVRRLELAGFYDRKQSSGAPYRAFVTAEQIAKWQVIYLGDVKKYTGRGLCPFVYLNGGLIQGGVWSGPGDNGMKLRIQPEDVAGIELYARTAELPAQYNRTRRPGEPDCATVIWTR